MRLISSLLLSLSLSLPALAIDFEYKVFYGQVKRLSDESTEALRFRFRFMQTDSQLRCHYKGLHIHTQKKDIPLAIDKLGYFSVPSERALYLARAKIQARESTEQSCRVESSIETQQRFLKTMYTAEELKYLSEQYNNFFSTMGSMMAFLMPQNQGLRFFFEDTAALERAKQRLSKDLNTSDITVANETSITLSNDVVDTLEDGITWLDTPIKIAPLLKRD